VQRWGGCREAVGAAAAARRRLLSGSGGPRSDQAVLGAWVGSQGGAVSGEGLEHVAVAHGADGVVRIALRRPAKMNALSGAMFDDLERAFERVAQAAASGDAARAVLLTGEGDHFCAGIDLGLLVALRQAAKNACPAREREALGRAIARMQRVCALPDTCPLPVVAAVHGNCIGAGVDLISACDIRLCTQDALFSVKEVDLAIVADLGTLQRLPSIVGEQRARELAYTGRGISGTEAKQMGLVLEALADRHALEAAAAKLTADIARKSPVTVRGVKKVMNFSREHTAEEGLEYVLRWNAAHMLSKDLDELVRKLLEKQAAKKTN
jgi:enoyl-CoA hydratase